jgi:hypothetical protein
LPTLAGEHDGHGLEAAVRVLGKAVDVVPRRIAAKGIEHQERVEPALQGLGEHAGELDAGTIGRGLAAHGALDAAGVLKDHGVLLFSSH